MTRTKAVEAHTDLNIFRAIKTILEGGSVHSQKGKRAAEKIIKICDAQMLAQIKIYDAEVAKEPQ